MYICIYIYIYTYILAEWGTNNNNYNRVPGAARGSTRTVPAISVDTLRVRRKEEIQH